MQGWDVDIKPNVCAPRGDLADILTSIACIASFPSY
jgi:hypothetical protein